MLRRGWGHWVTARFAGGKVKEKKEKVTEKMQ
jgi:hypothetical protein